MSQMLFLVSWKNHNNDVIYHDAIYSTMVISCGCAGKMHCELKKGYGVINFS